VARTNGSLAAGSIASVLVSLVNERTGYALDPERFTMTSDFRAERFLARRFVTGCCALAGDAAHVVSPIGGQGMNLGWLDAVALARTLERSLRRPAHAARALAVYEAERRHAARAAQRRAALFMALGRPTTTRLRTTAARLLLSAPVAPRAARFFTMRRL
jgi:2-polyprenyl-6-methoxyphenol hydroxylase-like FAD-dependent oxidoreductase